jgi:hypothetical protein
MQHPVTQKIRMLLDIGYPRQLIIRALHLVLECPWTTILIEENYAGGAQLLRYHPTYNECIFRARHVLHQARHLVGKARDEKVRQRLEDKISKLKAKKPFRRGGKQQLLMNLSARSQQVAPLTGFAAKNRQNIIVQQHSSMYKQLSTLQLKVCHAEARSAARRKRAMILSDIGILQGQIQLHDARAAQERILNGVVNHSDSLRFNVLDLERMMDMLSGLADESLTIAILKEQAYDCPICPHLAVQIAHQQVEQKLKSKAIIPWWCRYVCAFRDRFASSIIFKSQDGRIDVGYLLLFAKQNPMFAVFLQLKRQELTLPAFENWEAGHARSHVPRYKQTFQYRPYVYVLSGDLPFQQDDE